MCVAEMINFIKKYCWVPLNKSYCEHSICLAQKEVNEVDSGIGGPGKGSNAMQN